MNNCKYPSLLFTVLALSLTLLMGFFSFSPTTSTYKSSQTGTQSEQLISGIVSKKRCVSYESIRCARSPQVTTRENYFTYSLLNFNRNIDVQFHRNHSTIHLFLKPTALDLHCSPLYGHDEDLPALSLV